MKFMNQFKFIPGLAGGTCLEGTVDGKVVRTTNVVQCLYATHCVKTMSGTIYRLKDPKAGDWVSSLEKEQPQEAKRYEFFWLFSKSENEDPETVSFKKLMMNHDFYYSFSDDHGVWKRGEQEYNDILKLTETNPKFKQLWECFVFTKQ